jgi:hypothetical protein
MAKTSFGMKVGTGTIQTGGLTTNATPLQGIDITVPKAAVTLPVTTENNQQTNQNNNSSLLPPAPTSYNFSTVGVADVVLQAPTDNSLRNALADSLSPTLRQAAENSRPSITKNVIGIAGAREAVADTNIGRWIDKNQDVLGKLSPKTALGLGVPLYPVYRHFPITPIKPSVLPPDSLPLSEYTIDNADVVPVFKNQKTRKRPEILALASYNKAFQEDLIQFTPAGKLLSYNFQSKLLRDDMLKGMYNYVSTNSNDPNTAIKLREDEARDLSNLKDTETTLAFYNQVIAATNNLKKAFDLKTIPNTAFSNPSMLNLQAFFEKRMHYSQTSFNNFSDTKILGQLLFDYRSMMESYSLSLLDTVDSDRDNDTNAIRIDKTYGNTRQFAFSVVGIQGVSPHLESSFNGFISSLPTNPDDKIKLLFNTFTKELRVSRGLSNPEVRNLLVNYFGGNADGDPYDNVVGKVGDDIFVRPQGINSLASLLQFSREDIVTVLPFERRYVDDNQTIFVPGTRYFIDSLLNRTEGGSFNTRPLDQYVQRFSEVTSNAKKVISETYQFDTAEQRLTNDNSFTSFLSYVKNGTSTFEDKSTPSATQLAPVALLKLCESNKQLKLMVFQYLILYGLTKNTNENKKPFFTRLGTEIKGLGSLSYVRGTGNPDLQTANTELFPYLERLADDITKKVEKLLKVDSTKTISSPVVTFGDLTTVEAQSANGSVTFSLPADLPLNPNATSNSDASSENVGGSSAQRTTITGFDLKQILLSPTENNIFGGLIDLMHQLDQAATLVDNQNSYVLGGQSDNATTTRFNQLTTSMLFLLLFETVSSFVAKYFDVEFSRNSEISYHITHDLYLNSSIWGLLYDMSKTTKQKLFGKSNANPPPSVNSDGKVNSFNKTSGKKTLSSIRQNSSATNTNPNRGVTLDADGNPRPVDQEKYDALQESIRGRFPGDVGFASTAARTLPPSIAELARETGTAIAAAAGQAKLTPIMLRKANSLRAAISVLKQKLKEEDQIVKNVIYIFDVLGDILKRADNEAKSLNGLSSAVSETTNNSLIPAQLRISNFIYNEYKQLITDPTITHKTRVVTPTEWNLLQSLLKEKPFQNTNSSMRTKILAVGVPKNFSSYLFDRVDRSNIESGDKFEKTLDSDLINVVVYKKSAEDDDIIFMPQRFTFDLSLFRKQHNTGEESIDSTQSFETLLQKLFLTDYSTDLDNTRDGRQYNLRDILADDRWGFLGNLEKSSMFKNHIVSSLLSCYLSLATGIRITEEVFPETPYAEYRNHTGWVVAEFNKLTTGVDLPLDVLMATQKYNFLYSATQAFSDGYIKERVLKPKKFDRVFLLPIDIDSFVVDREATLRTQSGRNAVNQNRFQQRTVPVRPGDNELLYFDRSSEPNALIFEQYYVTIESVR